MRTWWSFSSWLLWPALVEAGSALWPVPWRWHPSLPLDSLYRLIPGRFRLPSVQHPRQPNAWEYRNDYHHHPSSIMGRHLTKELLTLFPARACRIGSFCIRFGLGRGRLNRGILGSQPTDRSPDIRPRSRPDCLYPATSAAPVESAWTDSS